MVSLSGGSHTAAPSAPTRSSRLTTTSAPAAESGLLPWRLGAPISRTVVLPGTGSDVVVLGGLTSAGTSANGIYSLDTSNGTLTHIGALAAGLHDAAGAELGGQYVMFGGGSPNTVDTVEAFATPASGTGSSATVIGTLPQPRSDAAAVTIGNVAYIVGGYDGTSPDPVVLATTDGHTFTPVASLPVPVRYPAVAAAGGKIYVFGGQAISATAQPVNDVQMVDPAKKKAAIVAHLRTPLEGAVAVTVGGRIYLAGGDSSVPEQSTVGVGTTQLRTSGSTSPGVGATGAISDAYHPTPQGPTAELSASSSTGASAPGAAAATTSVSSIWSYDPTAGKLLSAGRLQIPVSHAAAAVVGSTAWIIGGESNGQQQSTVQMLKPNPGFGTAGAAGAGSPYYGAKLLVADRGNNRLLLMDDTMHVVWTYPSATTPADPLGFYFPDDAFFVDHGTAIISNQEENETIVEIGFPSGKILWSYGHPKQPGAAPGYLHEPDDAWLLKNGQVSVADALNCRVLVLNHDGTVAHQIGTTGICVHNPPSSMGEPNGDTPLPDGNFLVSEITGSWVSEYSPAGQLAWTVHLPISYPSDPQQIGSNLYLLADYTKPGAVLEFNRQGQILFRYQESSGPGELSHPSLAELLPSGAIMVNDDYRNRMVAFDPTTGALVWQYGVNDSAGTAPGMLDTPDGFDVLMPDGSTPTHPQTG
ncbi:MAG: Kelch repeat-containing protein, partial [Acidimicrobiales bacterium]